MVAYDCWHIQDPSDLFRCEVAPATGEKWTFPMSMTLVVFLLAETTQA
jgi:hypothetical protein